MSWCCYLVSICDVFFFKQKTAYEMRISDWSSDVCSSDLKAAPGFVNQASFDAGALTIGEDVIHRARVGVRVRDTAMILYTSGTSANPKGCLLSHEAVVREASNLGRNRWEFDENDRNWSPMPLFHIAALLAALAALRSEERRVGQECVSTCR